MLKQGSQRQWNRGSSEHISPMVRQAGAGFVIDVQAHRWQKCLRKQLSFQVIAPKLYCADGHDNVASGYQLGRTPVTFSG